ncbi:MAG: helix-turn-helix transcriptional regulator [Bacillota bacterium]|jgi:predicted DNA-binding transcriptional regulator YafY
MKHNKAYRLLYLYDKLLKGYAIVKKEVSDYFAVDDKTIQRDIEELRAYLYEADPERDENPLQYDYQSRSYRLTKDQDCFFTKEEALVLAKILLDSRPFISDELKQILNKLLINIDPSQRSYLKNAILNESYHYIAPQHGKELLTLLWQLNLCIQEHIMINLTYSRMDGKINDWLVEPQGLIFSEFYFYLIARLHNSNHHNPAIFRVDRIQSWSKTSEKFAVPYTERFEEGEFRKRIQFMYGGKLLKVKFAFWGNSLEAVLDRLPTVRIVGREDYKTILEAEVYGDGIKMWFLSQGACLEVLEPESLRREMKEIVKELADSIYFRESGWVTMGK